MSFSPSGIAGEWVENRAGDNFHIHMKAEALL